MNIIRCSRFEFTQLRSNGHFSDFRTQMQLQLTSNSREYGILWDNKVTHFPTALRVTHQLQLCNFCFFALLDFCYLSKSWPPAMRHRCLEKCLRIFPALIALSQLQIMNGRHHSKCLECRTCHAGRVTRSFLSSLISRDLSSARNRLLQTARWPPPLPPLSKSLTFAGASPPLPIYDISSFKVSVFFLWGKFHVCSIYLASQRPTNRVPSPLSKCGFCGDSELCP